jgi:hypothetical protein
MPTVTKEQLKSTKETKEKKPKKSPTESKNAEIKRLTKLLNKERDKKDADLKKLAAQALRAGSSQGGMMMAALRKK